MITIKIHEVNCKYFEQEDVWEIYVPRKAIISEKYTSTIRIEGETETREFFVRPQEFEKEKYMINMNNSKMWKCHGFPLNWDDANYKDNIAIILT